ncbi:RHS repeat-associated core domain-containing protein [Streptomyces antibioticus]|uniref:RHS repeat-associated core domain-containing protein n=1 Tax=Streptomyces antibioticus TaxID=1890 RepID=UPI0036A410C7
MPVSRVDGKSLDKTDEAARNAQKRPPAAAWPEPGRSEAPLAAAHTKAKDVSAGGVPVALTVSDDSPARAAASGPASAAVQTLDRKTTKTLGVDGVVLAVRGVGGQGKARTSVEIDTSGFQHMYGGDWGSRLVVRQLPLCALTSPTTKGCGAATDLPSVADPKSGRLSVEFTLAAQPDSGAAPVHKAESGQPSASGMSAAEGTVLLAVTAAASGASGDFKASSLAPSASWSAGGSNGGFSWTYDLATPEVPGGLEPDLGLSYSSQAVDGRTAATNNQADWIGDGWSLTPGYVERRYTSCEEDKSGANNSALKVGDQCWKKDNAVLNLGGQTNTLVKDDTSGEWHLESDDGTEVKLLTDTALSNGDNDGEHWRITTPDGTRYYFGYNRPGGWTSGKDETNSAWTVPVFGNHSGEPCHAAAFKDSWCQQAWRWNLDAVEDPHGNLMTYYWEKEKNSYGRAVDHNTGASTSTSYDRGGYLKRIEYGLHDGNFYGTPAGKVVFSVSERCLSDCGTFDSAHAKNWPDVPFDQYCASGTECKDRYSPSFFTRKRLTEVSTYALAGGTHKPVDSWELTHSFPATGDGSDAALWLASITRTGHTGTGDVTMPAVTAHGVQMPNRVEGATTGGDPDPVPPLNRYRVYAIKNETGGTLGVTYSATDCKAGDVPTPSSNTRRCYPVMWSPPDAPADDYEPYLDWFHSYVVTQVLESDDTGGAPVKQTDYSYLGGLAWAKGDDEFTKAKHRTYGDRKGYGRVQVRTGAGGDTRTLKEYRYFRGIDGAEVKDTAGVAVTDHAAFAGMTREEATYTEDGGSLQTATSYTPWHSTATASHARSGLSALKAYATGSQAESTRTAVGSDWRTTKTERTFDSVGQVLTESRLGDTAVTGDEECATTKYAQNNAKNIRTLIAEIRTVAAACDKTPSLPADLISMERHYYDGATSLTSAPVKGDVTRLEEQDAAGTGYLITEKATYDKYGRELTSTDALENKTTTTYVPTTGETPKSKTTANALGHTAIVEYEQARGVATASIDVNGKRTDAEHDGLGRVLRVWNPGHAKADHADSPSARFGYTISHSTLNAIKSETLKRDGTYATSYTLYDGLLRERQTQAPAIGTTDRLVTETRYDTRGWTWKTYGAYYAEGAPSGTLVTAADNTVPVMTENVHDGLGRVTTAISRSYGDEKWRTATEYGGDRVTVIPPAGGTASTRITDARGRTTELRQYTDADRTAYDRTTYAYGKYDEPVKVTDPAGNEWNYTFDARGQKTAADDPDKGETTTVYDELGRATSTTDARGITLTTGYDVLGRSLERKQGGTVLAKWTYDTVAKGQLTSSTRYVDGAAYTSSVGGYSDAYQPTSATVSVPSAAGALAGDYTWTYGYDTVTGALDWTKHPAVGNVPSERVTVTYNSDDLPIRTTRGGVIVAGNTLYDVYSRPTQTEFGLLGKKVYQSRFYDEHSGRMTRQVTDRDTAPQRIDDTTYAYDAVGNVTGITTARGQDEARSTDIQCFDIDLLGRLTEAWTAKTECSNEPSETTVGGPDSYWHTYSHDALGNRSKLVEHETGGAGADVTTTYTHAAAKTGLPHAVQEATGSDGARSTFGYDEAGNTTERTMGTRTQDLTWDAEGHLATLTEAGTTTSYVYDAEGNRLLARNADGSSTLTLPGGNELTVSSGGTKTGTRYYTHNGATVAVRTGSAISYVLADHQGTALAAVAASDQAITRRTQLPYGGLRSEQAFPGTRGFVGGTTDPTGLTHLGAREYDPVLGRFLSVDPVIDFGDPAQMNAYSYSHNNPVTKSDPDGLRPLGPTDGGSTSDYSWGLDRGMDAGYVYKNGKWVWKQTPKKDKASQKKYAAYKASPTHYMIDDSYAKARQKQAAKERAQALQAKRDREAAEQRKRDGIWGNIKKGNWGAAWDTTKNGVGDAADYVMSYKNTSGICLSAGGAFGVGVSAAGCFVRTIRPDGKVDYGVSGTLEETVGVGLGATLGFVNSNADDFDQLRGEAAGVGVEAGDGLMVSLSHRGTFGTRNARGDIVHTGEVGFGLGAGVSASAGSGVTGVTKLWTW